MKERRLCHKIVSFFVTAPAVAKDPDPSVAGHALAALTDMGERDSRLLDAALARLSSEPNMIMRDSYPLYEQLVEFEPSPAKVVPIIERALSRPELDLWPARALAKHDPKNKMLVPYLIKILESDEHGWKSPSLEILARPEVAKSAEALSYLKKYAANEKYSESDRAFAAQALVESGDLDPSLLRLLLSSYQKTSPEVISRLRNLVKKFPFSDNPELLKRVIVAASQEGEIATVATDLLKEWHKKNRTVERELRAEILDTQISGSWSPHGRIHVLGELGPRDPESISVLRNFLDLREGSLARTAAAFALEESGHSSPQTRQILAEFAQIAADNPESLRHIRNKIHPLIKHSGLSSCGEIVKKLVEHEKTLNPR